MHICLGHQTVQFGTSLTTSKITAANGRGVAYHTSMWLRCVCSSLPAQGHLSRVEHWPRISWHGVTMFIFLFFICNNITVILFFQCFFIPKVKWPHYAHCTIFSLYCHLFLPYAVDNSCYPLSLVQFWIFLKHLVCGVFSLLYHVCFIVMHIMCPNKSPVLLSIRFVTCRTAFRHTSSRKNAACIMYGCMCLFL